MEKVEQPTLNEERDPATPEEQNTDAGDAELQFESPSPASEGEEVEEGQSETHAAIVTDARQPEVQEVLEEDPPAEEPIDQTLPAESLESPEQPEEPQQLQLSESDWLGTPEKLEESQPELPQLLKEEERSRRGVSAVPEGQGHVAKLKNFFRHHAEERNGHNPSTTSKIHKSGAVTAVPDREIQGTETEMGKDVEKPEQAEQAEAEQKKQSDHDHIAEAAGPTEPVEPMEQPAVELVEPLAYGALESDAAEGTATTALTTSRQEDDVSLLPGNFDEERNSSATSRPFIEAEEASVPASAPDVAPDAPDALAPQVGKAHPRNSEQRRSKSAGPFLAETPERELARRVWRASAAPRAGTKPREILTHPPRGQGALQIREDSRRLARGKNGPRSLSPRPHQATRRVSSGRSKQSGKEDKEPRVWKVRKFQPEAAEMLSPELYEQTTN